MEPSWRLSENLRRLRAETGYSQEELAFRAAINRTQVSLLEGGHQLPRLLTFVKIAGGLNVTANDLLDGIRWEPIVFTTGGMKVSDGKEEAP